MAFFWTNRHGNKILLSEMDTEYLINCYRRMKESFYQHQEKNKMECVGIVCGNRPPVVDKDYAELWVGRLPFDPAVDESKDINDWSFWNEEMDANSGCVETCEAF